MLFQSFHVLLQISTIFFQTNMEIDICIDISIDISIFVIVVILFNIYI